MEKRINSKTIIKIINTIITLLLLAIPFYSYTQTTVEINLDSLSSSIEDKFEQGVFYVPKTNEAQTDFLNNNIHQNSIRLNVIESALNNTANLTDCIAYLDNATTILQNLSNKTDKLIFIFEKMPAWLSSSSDGSPAGTPGWYVLNTKPPSSWLDWNNMVNSIVDRIVNTYGIDNAYFEIWNEPDLGSWTGSQTEYFELFRNTYDAIKTVNSTIPVGGPATNHWGKNINFEPPYGYLSNQIADSSLIGQLIDSTYVWNKPLGFISWHNFNIIYQSTQNAVDFINQKYAALALATPELIISEWNTPSSVRDTPLQKAFFIKNQMEMAKTPITNNTVAAWQDFNQFTNEFHNDYGLLSYGSIHKPAYNALLLSDKLIGTSVLNTSNAPTDIISTISNDTLHILITNYTPPAFIEAFNHTLFEGHFNANQIDNAGYIDIASSDLSQLDSIYKGQITIPNSTAINIAINNSIPIYSHYDSLQTINRSFNLTVNNLSGNHNGISYKIDTSNNNTQYRYDSLLTQGFTQTDAITNCISNQDLHFSPIQLTNGQVSFSMQPNAIQLFQFVIPEALNTSHKIEVDQLIIFPNPTTGIFNIKSSYNIGKTTLSSIDGSVILSLETNNTNMTVDLSSFAAGIYVLRIIESNKTIKIIKR